MVDYQKAQQHLSQVDPALAAIIAEFGPCRLHPERHYFTSLADAIVSQQLSVKASATILRRFKEAVGGRIKPEAVLKLTDEQFRAVGVSRQKMGYLRDLAAKWQAGVIEPKRFAKMSDEEVIEALTQVKGIGRWTAEMFLIFTMLRPDVLPVDDLGFRTGIKKAYRMRKLPDARRIEKLARAWRPYRSIGTWYMWASLKNK